jgi:hypothetical protein
MTKISNAALEEAVLCLLAFSAEHAATVALRIRDNSLFTNKQTQDIAKTSLAYIEKYSIAPGMQLEYLLESELRRGDEGRVLKQEIDLLRKQSILIQPQFIIEQLDHFIAIQQLQKTLETATDLVDQGELEQAKEALYKQVSIQTEGSKGIQLFDPGQAFRFLDKNEEHEFFSSGIEVFDRKGIRPERKTLMFIIAAAKRGKSWWLTDVGKAAIQHHHKVLHLTLELSEEKTAKRYIQALFSLTKDEAQEVRTPYFQRDGEGGVVLSFRDIIRDSVIAKRKEVSRKLLAMANSFPPFLIKEYPPGMLSTEQLCLYLDSLKRGAGHEIPFDPDIIIVDYADLMRIDSSILRIDTGRLYKELRGIAVSRDKALVTASQGNKESDEANLVGKKHIAEDWSKIGTADNVITYSQTPEEKRLGLARIYAAAGRDSEDGFTALISQNYRIGQFCLDSTAMTMELANQLQQGSENG